ncbi:MAG: MCE family protein [Candidatus Omnitrophica bacterium]|nr:MCE family protein [Candidatus Omnitrophota bacterium]
MAINLWDKNKSFTYIKLGSFFLVAILIFFAALLSIREISIFKGSYVVIVKFKFAEGLRISSPVRFCGVDVGEVKKVIIKEVGGKSKVYVYSKVQEGVRIPKNSYFFVNSLSLFGEKYLEITPPVESEGYIKEGDVIEGTSPVPLFKVFAAFTKTMKEIDEFMKEGKIKNSFENILFNIEDISLDIKGVIKDMRNKQGTIGRLMYDDSLYQTTEEFLVDLKAHPWKLLHKPKTKRKP